MQLRSPITPSLWFDGNAEEAANFYVSLFSDSRIVRTIRWQAGGPYPEGTALAVDFELGGRPFNALNGGAAFPFDEAISFIAEVSDQAELDALWEALLAGGGVEGQCGWLKDQFGLSWQVVPRQMTEWMTSDDTEAVARITQVMLTMVKLDIAPLQAAFEGRS